MGITGKTKLSILQILFKSTLVVGLSACSSPASESNNVSEKKGKSMENLREEKAKNAIKKNPELFSSDIREAVLKGKIIIGMTPFQAQLAGGAFAFRVSADPAHWGANADPYLVMEAQTYHPDNSKIRMTFQNNTQYHGERIQTFHVEFVNGQAYIIKKIQGDIHAK